MLIIDKEKINTLKFKDYLKDVKLINLKKGISFRNYDIVFTNGTYQEKELIKGYDFNSLTDYKSVLEFRSKDTDLNSNILSKLSLLFVNYFKFTLSL